MNEMTIDDMVNSYKQSQGNALSVEDMVASYKAANKNKDSNQINDLIDRSNPQAKAIGAGLSEGAAGIARLLSGVIDRVTAGSTGIDLGATINKIPQEWAESERAQYEASNPTTSNEVVKYISSMLPAMALTGGVEGAAAKSLAPIFRMYPKLFESIKAVTSQGKKSKYATSLAKTIPGGALFGASVANPDEDISTGALVGAVASPIGKGTFDIAGNAIKKLSVGGAIKKIADYFAGDYKDIEKVIKDAEGVTPMAGNALKNADINRLEVNTLPTIPSFQKAAVEKLSNMAKYLFDQGNGIFNKLTNGMNKSEISDGLQEATQQNARSLRKEKQRLYKERNDIAKKLGVKVNLGNFAKTAKSLKKNFSKVYEATGVNDNETGIKSLRSIISKVHNKNITPQSKLILPLSLQEAIKKTPRTVKNTSMQTAHLAKSAIDKAAFKARVAGDASTESIYNRLSEALGKDIDAIIDKSENAPLKEAHKKANAFYKEHIVPLSDKKISSIINNKVDTDTIADTFLPMSGGGRINLLKKITKNAPGSEKLLLTNALSKSLDTNMYEEQFVNPGKLYTALKKIGSDRLKLLVKNPEELKEIQRFFNNVDNGREALTQMFNPATGYRGLANSNIFETTKAAQDLLENILAGNKKKTASTVLAWAQNIAKGRAVNDPQLLQKVLAIKKNQPLNLGFGYNVGSGVQELGGPLAKAFAALLINSGEASQ